MITIAVIIFAVLMVVGSVAWVRPSRRDVKLAEWRMQARQAGLHVKLDALPAEPKDSGIRDDVSGASYYLYQASVPKTDQLNWAVVKAQGWLQEGLPQEWSWYQQEVSLDVVELSKLLELSPLPILAIERTPKYSRIVWGETGTEFNAPQLKLYLQEIQAIS